MRLWSIWNLFSSFLYFAGFLVGLVFTGFLVVAYAPAFILILLWVLVCVGFVLGVASTLLRHQQNKRDAMERELQDMAAGRSPDSHLNG